MSGRNRGAPPPHGGHLRMPPAAMHDPHYGMPMAMPPPHTHPALLDEIRESHPFGMDPRQRLPPHHHHHHHHAAILEENLAAQHQDIQALLADNQRLAATHVALKQELELAHHELQRLGHVADSFHLDKDVQVRELQEKCMRLEMDVRGVEAMRNELTHVNSDVKELTEVRKDLNGKVQAMNQDLARYKADLQQVPMLKAEIENTKQELQRARAAIEYEKKGYAENYEHGLVMEKNLITMARELEKLRAEIANAEKRAHTAAAVGNPGAAYIVNYGNPEAGYGGNPYPTGYGMNHGQANAEGFPQFMAGPGSWGGYDMQRAQGQR